MSIFRHALVLVAAVSASENVYAACVPNAEAEIQAHKVGEVFSEFFNEEGKEVVIYKLPDSKKFLAAEGTRVCITAVEVISKDELSERYGIEDESECEECAGEADAGDGVSEEQLSGNQTGETVSADSKSTSEVSSMPRTAFRGVALGMTKTQAMSAAIDGFIARYKEGVPPGADGFFTHSTVSLEDGNGESCASLRLTQGTEIVDKLTMQECFFKSKNATLESFARQFSASYNMREIKRDLLPLENGISEIVEATSAYGETVKISKKTVKMKGFGRVSLPVEVEVEAPFGEASFD